MLGGNDLGVGAGCNENSVGLWAAHFCGFKISVPGTRDLGW